MMKRPFPFSNTCISHLNTEQGQHKTGETEDQKNNSKTEPKKMNPIQNNQITEINKQRKRVIHTNITVGVTMCTTIVKTRPYPSDSSRRGGVRNTRASNEGVVPLPSSFVKFPYPRSRRASLKNPT